VARVEHLQARTSNPLGLTWPADYTHVQRRRLALAGASPMLLESSDFPTHLRLAHSAESGTPEK
jgi:hypothetical protein